jgi:hypothetical protein
VVSLTLEVAENPSVAGEAVAYTVTLEGGAAGSEIEYTISSSVEADLDYDSELLRPLVAGEHSLVATATYEGNIYQGQEDLVVNPATAENLNLVLEDLATTAGIPLSFVVDITDAYGNTYDPTLADVSLDSEDALVVADKVVSTIPGVYEVTASFEALSDSELFVVLTGDAAFLDLWLEDEDLELFETTVAHVDITDLYGNLIEEPWLLWTDPGDGVRFQYNAITFEEEGEFLVWASTADGLLTDFVGPLLIDSTGPDLAVENPERGTQTTESGATVYGTVSDEHSGVASVTVNGESASVNELGEWEQEVEYEFGMNFVETVAMDADGNPTSDTRAVISGNYTPYGNGAWDGLVVRVNEGGFDVIESMADGFVDSSTLSAAIPSPVFYDYSGWEECFDPCFGWFGGCEFCWSVTWYEIAFYLQNFSISGTELEIDPNGGGWLDTVARILDPYMDYSASGSVLGIGYSASGYVAADHIQLDMELLPFVSSGQLWVDVQSASASTSNFDFDLDSWIYDAANFFGVDVDGLVEGYLVDALVDMAQDEVPELINDALADLEIAETIEIEGNTYDVDALPARVEVDDWGLTLGLESYVTTPNWVTLGSSDPGSLAYPYTAPTFGTNATDMELGINLDFLNQLFHAMWGGGLLDMELYGEDLGIDMEDLSLFFPELTDLALVTRPYLPPVVVPGTGTDLMDLQIGDLELSLYNGVVDENELFLRVYVSLVAGMELVTNSDNRMVATIGEPTMIFDVAGEGDGSRYTASTEAFLEALVPLLLPMLTDSLGEITLPDFTGFGLSNVSVTLEGAESGFVVAAGDLSAN